MRATSQVRRAVMSALMIGLRIARRLVSDFMRGNLFAPKFADRGSDALGPGAWHDQTGADTSKAIIILNPAEPPIMMRNTVFGALPEGTDHDAVLESIYAMEKDVAQYVPGYRLKNPPVIEEGPYNTPGGVVPHRVVVLLEVEGAGDYLPPYAGNLDIMTAAAMRVGEAVAEHRGVSA